MDWCQICQRFVHPDATCRHLRWDQERGCLCGTGGTHIDPGDHKASVQTVCRALAAVRPNTIPAFRAALRTGVYAITTRGTLFGADTIVFDFAAAPQLFQDRYVALSFRELFGDEEPETIARVSLGNSWLLSLEAGRTRDADALTLAWLDEVLPPDTPDTPAAPVARAA